MSSVGSLFVHLGLDSAQFRRGLSAAERRIGETGRKMRRLGLAASGVATAFSALAIRIGANIDAQAKLARSLSTSTASMRVMQRAGELAGVRMSEIEAGASRLTRRLSMFIQDGGGPAAKAIEQLGLNAQKLMALPLDQRIAEVSRAIEENADASERAALYSQLFGDRAFAAFSRLNAETIAQARSEVERMGLAISEVDAQQIELANDRISKLSMVVSAAGDRIAVTILPALGRLAEALSQAFEKGKWLRGVLDFFTDALVGRIVSYSAAIATLSGGFVALRIALWGVNAALVSLRAALIRTGLGALVVGIGELIYRLSGMRNESDDLASAMGGVSEEARAEMEAVRLLNEQIDRGATLSSSAARIMLEEARARHENISAVLASARARILEGESYQKLVAANTALAELRAAGDERANDERVLARHKLLRDAVVAQEDALNDLEKSVRLSAENIADLEAGLASSTDGFVRLGDAAGSAETPLQEMVQSAERMSSASVPAAANIAELAREYGTLAGAAHTVAQAQHEMAFAEVMGEAARLQEGLGALAFKVRSTTGEMGQMAAAVDALQRAQGPEELAKAFARVAEEVEASAGGVDNMDGETRQLYQSTVAVAGKMVDVVQAAQDGTRAASGFANSIAYAAQVASQLGAQLRYAAGALGGLARGLGAIASAVPGVSALSSALGGAAGNARTLFGSFDWSKIRREVTGIGSRMATIAQDAGRVAPALGRGSGGAARAARQLREELPPAQKAAKALADTFRRGLTSAIDGVGDAFGELFTGGIRSFEDFAKRIFSGFKSLIAKMISTAIANPIKLSLGLFGGPGPAAAGGGGGGGGLISGLMGTALGTWGGTTGIMGGLSTAWGGLTSGGLSGMFTGMGTAFTAGPLAALGAALPIIGVGLALFAAFRTKTKELDAGIDVHLRGLQATAQKYQTLQKSQFFGLSRWKVTKRSAAGADIVGPLQEAYGQLQQETRKTAAIIGTSTSALDRFRASFKLTTKGKSADQVQRELGEWVQGVNDSLAREIYKGAQALHLLRPGESAAQTLREVAVSLEAVNAAFSGLGLRTISRNIFGADHARNILEHVGGVQKFGQAADTYLQAFYSAQERADKLADKLRNGLGISGVAGLASSLGRAMGLSGVGSLPQTMQEYRQAVERLSAQGDSFRAAKMISLAPMFQQWQKLREEVQRGVEAERQAAERAAQAVLRQREGLLQALWRLQGREDLLRQKTLSGLDASNHALQRRIWALEDHNKAQEKAADAARKLADERSGLIRRIWELQGREDLLRRDTLKGLNAANHAYQRHIWALEGAAEAARKASEAFEKLTEDFSLSNDYRTQSDAQLAQIAKLRGYEVDHAVIATGAAEQSRDLGRMRETSEEQGRVMKKVLSLLETWMIDGTPKERNW